MFSRVRIAIRFFFVGLAVGVLLAPRSGEETRRLVREKADRLLNDILDAATLGTYESGAGSMDTDEDRAAAPAATTRTPRSRAGNGSRKGTTSTAETSPSTAGA
jgi:gas vesicle protein